MSEAPQVLLAHHLKAPKLPSLLRGHGKPARQCAAEGVDHTGYPLRPAELEPLDRERRPVERRIRQARFPAVKGLDSFDFAAIPALSKPPVPELARCACIGRREDVTAPGNSGTGKTHAAPGLGLAACQKGLLVGLTTAAALVHGPLEARGERRLPRLQKQPASHHLPIVDARSRRDRGAASRFRPPERSCRSSPWAKGTNEDRCWRPAIRPLTSGPASSARNGSRVPCPTGSRIASTSWR